MKNKKLSESSKIKNIKKNLQNIIVYSEKFQKIVSSSLEFAKKILGEIENNERYNNHFINNLITKIKELNEHILEIFNSNYNLYLKKENENISSFINTININSLSNKETFEIIGREFEYTQFYDEVNNYFDLTLENNKQFKRSNYNKHFYTIDFFTEHEIIFNKKDRNEFYEQIKSVLDENINKIVISDCTKEFYLNGILHSSRFNSIIKLKAFKDLDEIKFLRTIIDYIGLNNIDYRGNSLYFNKSKNKKRGSEDYYPPENWIALGIKIINKYENNDWIENKASQWAICYHPIISIYLLPKIITEGLKPGESQFYKDFPDKRHINQKVGTGVYLYQKIQMAENIAKEFLINGKKYKLVFMVKAAIEKIKEPININYWVVDPKYTRIYRILIKEM